MGNSDEEPQPKSDDMSSLPGVPPGYVGFVRPPPAPPPTARQARFEPLVTVGGAMIVVGIVSFLAGFVLVLLLAIAGWGPIGVTIAGSGLGLIALGLVLYFLARRLQRG